MSTLPVYLSFGLDLFGSSSNTCLPDIYATEEKSAGRASIRTASEQRRLDKIDAILAVPARYREANWDGEGAPPIPESAIHEARKFLEKLPAATPLPEAILEPDGYLGLEWYANKSLLYVVSFDGKGALSCSGLIGPERVYGTRYMDNGIPAEILHHIASVV